ncbi:MAG: hypothetical protein ACREFO_14550 [Acetobacteraceae bacterium]
MAGVREPRGGLDEYALLKTMLDNWSEIFAAAFDRRERHCARSFLSIARDAGNAVSHLALDLPDEDALRGFCHLHHTTSLRHGE